MSTITGTTINHGVTLATSGTYASPLTITATGAIEAVGYAVFGPAGYAWTVDNQGTISAAYAAGIKLADGGSVINSGTILSPASSYAVLILGAAGVLTNSRSGYIGSGGVYLFGGSVVNDGRIVDTDGASVNIAQAAGTVINAGMILGTNGPGVKLIAGGSVANNAGLIEGSGGVYIGRTAGTVTNSGTIIGTAVYGIVLAAGGTVVDAGTIAGAGGTAILFGGTGGNLLVLEPGYSLGGVVVGGTSAGATSTLELASAASSGTVTAALQTEFVNFGTVDVDVGAQWRLSGTGTIGHSLTLGDSGTLTNAGTIVVSGGNTMTISVGGGSELANAGEIVVNGGSLVFSASVDATDGGYVPIAGAVVIEGGGSVETNVAYPSSVIGTEPTYEFGDATPGDTLKIDDIGRFGGAILGFGAGDTIDLGASLAVTQAVYDKTTGILNLSNAGGTVVSSLYFTSGNFTSSSFIIGTGSNDDTVLTTNVQNDVYNNSFGAWQTSALWSNATTPGTVDTAFVGDNATSAFTLTTGTNAVSVGALVLAGSQSLLQITSDTAISPYVIQQSAGTLEVASGNTLTASGLLELGGTTEVDPAGTLDLTGHSVLTSIGAINGTLSVSSSGTFALQLAGGTLLVNGGTLDAGAGQSGGNGGGLSVGSDGGGAPVAMTVQNSGTNAGIVIDTYAILASDPASYGTLTLSGNVSWTDEIDPHDTANTTGYMLVGADNQVTNAGTLTPPPFSGAATLTVENGAALTEQSFATIGATEDSSGGVLVSNARWNIGTATGGFLNVGQAAAGAVIVTQSGTVQVGGPLTFVSNGSTSTGSGINLGVSAGATGSLTVTGAGSLITDNAGMTVGQTGTGSLQILSGGTIQLTGTNGVTIGVSAAGGGTILVSGTDPGTGASALLSVGTGANGITVGGFGRGTLDVGSGGTVQARGFTIGTGGSLVLSGGTVTASASSTNAGQMSGFGAFIGQLANSGTVSASGGTLTLDGAVSNTGSVAITGGAVTIIGVLSGSGSVGMGSGAVLNLGSAAYGGGLINFASSTDGELALADDADFSDTISGLNVGAGGAKTDFIDIEGHTVTIGLVSGQGTTSGTIALSDGEVIKLTNLSSSNWFADTVGDDSTGTDVFVSDTPCFCRGTQILTERGEVAVEDLAIGDEVVTLSGAARPVKWIGRRAYDPRFVAGNRAVLPIRVEAGTLGDGVPARDLWVSPEHALSIDGLLVPARLLVNGLTIRQVESIDRLEYFHIELGSHDVIFADGAAAESFGDSDNRGMFHNAAEFAALYPEEPLETREFCAPRVAEDTAELAAIRRTLLSRAEALGRTTRDPDLHLIADGDIVRAASGGDGIYRFAVAAGTRRVALVSRSAVPAEVYPSSLDGRALGVPVERVVLGDAGLRVEIGHNSAALGEGFHDDEAALRWSDGRGFLPEGILTSFAGDIAVEVHLAGSALIYRSDPAALAADPEATDMPPAAEPPGPAVRAAQAGG